MRPADDDVARAVAAFGCGGLIYRTFAKVAAPRPQPIPARPVSSAAAEVIAAEPACVGRSAAPDQGLPLVELSLGWVPVTFAAAAPPAATPFGWILPLPAAAPSVATRWRPRSVVPIRAGDGQPAEQSA